MSKTIPAQGIKRLADFPERGQTDYRPPLEEHTIGMQTFVAKVNAARPFAFAALGAGITDAEGDIDELIAQFAGTNWGADTLADALQQDQHTITALGHEREAGFYVGVALGLMLRPELFNGGAR